MKIVFDSTVLVSNFQMTGLSFRLLELYLKNWQARLVVPWIVLAEAKNKYLEQAKECIEAAGKESADRKRPDLGGEEDRDVQVFRGVKG